MQLLSVALARSVWLFDMNEMNPTGKSLFPEILLWAGEKYSFQTFPKSITDIDNDTKSYVFKMGQFHAEDGPINVNLSFYNDGLVAESWASTEKTDAFLEDLLRSASQKYGLSYQPEMIRSKRYVSELIVRLSATLSDINPKVLEFSQALSSAFAAYKLLPFEMMGISFGLDSSESAYKPPGFTIERKVGAPFSDNRFWSRSPFATSDHFRLVGQFEEMLLSLKG